MRSIYELIKPYLPFLRTRQETPSISTGWHIIKESDKNPELKRHYEGWTIMVDYNREAEHLIDFLNSSIPSTALVAYVERYTAREDSVNQPEALRFNRGIGGNNTSEGHIKTRNRIDILSVSSGICDDKVVVERSLESILKPAGSR